MKKIATAVLGFSLVLTALPLSNVQAAGNPVQVKLEREYNDISSLSFQVIGNYTIKDASVSLKEKTTYTLKYEASKIVLYEGATKLVEKESELTFVPESVDENHLFKMNDDQYMGEMKIAVEKKAMQPINILPMEDYLKGVVPNEMPSSWGEEALKAQAITARTYAKDYEGKVINDTTDYQVYGGLINFNKDKIKKVVEETKGQYLTYKGTLAKTYYSSSNGGYTESSENVWGGKIDYLIAKPDSMDVRVQTNWMYRFTHTQIDLTGRDLARPENWWNLVSEKEVKREYLIYLKNQVAEKEKNAKEIKIIDIPHMELSKPTSSNPRTIKGTIKLSYMVKGQDDQFVKDENGDIKIHIFEKTYPANQLRTLFGNKEFKSALITSLTFDEITGEYIFEGLGFGHGVGMSQNGANERAKAGQTYQDILNFYYPGTTVSEKIETPSTPSTPKTTYTVRKGDTLYSISKKYGVTVADLKKANNLSSDALKVGQVLIVPTSDSEEKPVEKPTVEPPFEKPVEKPTVEKPTVETPVEKPVETPSTPTTTYTVQKGDTLYGISKKYGVSMDDLKKANNLSGDTVKVGQTLKIPSKGTTQPPVEQPVKTKPARDKAPKSGQINVYVKGKQQTMDVKPLVKSGTTMVPVRVIMENLGLTVKWDQKTNTATVLDNGKEIKMTIGKKTATINGRSVTLPLAPMLEKSRTLIPLRFVAESTGYTVDWEQKTNSIDIY